MKTEHKVSRRDFLEKLAPATLGIVAGSGMMHSAWAYDQATGAMSPKVSATDEKKFVPVMITPFGTDLKIDYDNVSRVVDFYLAAGAKGFFANCLSSEMYFLNDQERIDLTRHVVMRVKGKVPVVSTGSFGDSLADKALFAKKIEDTGADGVILISSHFARQNDSDAVLMENFEQFFALTGNMKLGTYECPSPYKRILSPEVFRFLVSNRNLIYHKDTTEDIGKIEEKLAVAKGTQMELYNAHSATALRSLQKGAKGMSPISGNFYPEIHTWLCQNADNPAKSEDANWIQAEITRMEPLISKSYPLSSKYFLKKRGLPIELTCRAKSKVITPEQQQVLDTAYKTFIGWCDRLGIEPAKT
ncbi:4-hydroxy-tetrahydrodipicolinate synthase [Dyadobacter sp. BE34]|uniref:4-hydroxy-tetrahydrodipicolinate synthase n=1 Tax=Dyadobacter fermentans TaxID=94254 RepID=A0ABU1R0G9_9BACT|nr:MULTISPECIES: dihydrodipicolinate synthase family protein [Dyadobacter]MDR6806909.1 4-hydroxy-tetrahydrodipicolinate synthase [Dyadobacter fermentans]MDR7044651.1 4-hydroxy-tetrahydrodipicolinate synthase [Dyadobacter sp. BE242]MDR7198961.1 4-hydroxy-tetrahydrodipicolinate synthase [Dyadobacter sp. BE34]MDR7216923.1 4-hydroxy-tetrahydrodipicolinate synthase [Dyadobacter sp. BE31]MDR7263551.1 4-hydroxy-tetrahydrodipicolinate synthase [Dyadobacter sp. BE32]